MLSLTLEATHAIAEILADPELPVDAGLRIVLEGPAGGNGHGQLQVALAESPSEDDEVLEKAGARVFVPAPLAAVLADKCLDAELDGDDAVQFTLERQARG
jgi:iron-sulfur cluster assembly protein